MSKFFTYIYVSFETITTKLRSFSLSDRSINEYENWQVINFQISSTVRNPSKRAPDITV